MSNMLHGTWRLNVAESVVEPGPLVRSELRVYDAIGEDDLQLLVEGVDATRAAYSYSAIGRIDGNDYRMTGSGTRNGTDWTVWTRIDSHTFNSTVKKAGNVVNLPRLEISQDGNVLTVREHGIDPNGIATRGVRTYDKQ